MKSRENPWVENNGDGWRDGRPAAEMRNDPSIRSGPSTRRVPEVDQFKDETCAREDDRDERRASPPEDERKKSEQEKEKNNMRLIGCPISPSERKKDRVPHSERITPSQEKCQDKMRLIQRRQQGQREKVRNWNEMKDK